MTSPHDWNGPEYGRQPEPNDPQTYRNYPEHGAPAEQPGYPQQYGQPQSYPQAQPYGTPPSPFPIAQPPTVQPNQYGQQYPQTQAFGPVQPYAQVQPYAPVQPYGQQGYAVSLYGQAPYGQPVVAPKNPGLCLLASLILPGLGSMINGEVGKGIGIMIGFFLCAVTSIMVLPAFGALGLWIWGMVDAFQGAQRWNAQHGIIS